MNRARLRRRLIAVLGALVCAAPVAAQTPAAPIPPTIETPAEAVAQDAAEYAGQFGVPLDEAEHRLQAQTETVAVTDQLGEEYRDRLAGISIEHKPTYRIIVYLTGDIPVPTQHVTAGGIDVPIVFRTGAKATRDRVIWAMTYHQGDIRKLLPTPPAMGLDPTTGELILIVTRKLAPADVATLQPKIAALTGVPVRLRVLDRVDVNLDVAGGSRVEGTDPTDGKRYVCTTGFAVTNGAKYALTTAAHCVNDLDYRDPQSHALTPLHYEGQWGWGYRDVQINSTEGTLPPLFYSDTAKTILRPVTGQRTRDDTRAGDFVCHRGERTGYSCSLVELTDFAPAGDLCGGPCLPNWVTVSGPTCKGGDSGSPVFSGTAAFGILKGGSYRPDGTCAFYFYMSADYLPPGWSLVTAPLVSAMSQNAP